MNLSALIPCFFFLVSDFRQLPCRYFLQFFTLFLHSFLCIWNFQRLRHRNEFVNKTVMSKRIYPFCSDVILMRFVSSSCLTWSHAFVDINNTSVFGLAFPDIAVGHTTVLYRYFARHCCWHRNFQLSTGGFQCELEIFVVWLNEEYSYHLPGIVELWFLDCPSLLCFLFCCMGHKFLHTWPYIIRS